MPTANAGIRSSPRLIRADPLSSCLAIAGLRKRDKVTALCFDSCELRVMGRSNINNLRQPETVIFLSFFLITAGQHIRGTLRLTEHLMGMGLFSESKSGLKCHGCSGMSGIHIYTCVIQSEPRNLRRQIHASMYEYMLLWTKKQRNLALI